MNFYFFLCLFLYIQILLAEKEELEKELKTLKDKLSSALSEFNTKDELVRNHAKMAQEAIKGLIPPLTTFPF